MFDIGRLAVTDQIKVMPLSWLGGMAGDGTDDFLGAAARSPE